MDVTKIVKDFYAKFEKMDLEGVLPLFAPNAMISSPTMGKKTPPVFYKELFSRTTRIRVVIKDILLSPENPNRAAAWTNFGWELKQGDNMTFEGIVIFEINAQGKIESLIVIYDAQLAREALRKAG